MDYLPHFIPCKLRPLLASHLGAVRLQGEIPRGVVELGFNWEFMGFDCEFMGVNWWFMGSNCSLWDEMGVYGM